MRAFTLRNNNRAFLQTIMSSHHIPKFVFLHICVMILFGIILESRIAKCNNSTLVVWSEKLRHFIRKLNLSKDFTNWIYELERHNDQNAFLFNPMKHSQLLRFNSKVMKIILFWGQRNENTSLALCSIWFYTHSTAKHKSKCKSKAFEGRKRYYTSFLFTIPFMNWN